MRAGVQGTAQSRITLLTFANSSHIITAQAYRLCPPLAKYIFTRRHARAPALQPAGDGAAARVGQGHDSNDGRWYTTGRTAPVPEYVFSLTPYHSPTHD